VPHYTQRLAPDARDILINCLVGVVLVPLVIPWGYIFKQYVRAPGNPWAKQLTVATQASVAQDTGRT
jgi:hypothetical protein